MQSAEWMRVIRAREGRTVGEVRINGEKVRINGGTNENSKKYVFSFVSPLCERNVE